MSTEVQVDALFTPEIAEALNRRCRCVSVDMDALRAAVTRDCAHAAPGMDLLHDRPHLFAAPPVFLARSQAAAMRELIRAVETVVALPAWHETVLARSPAIARFTPRASGVFLGFDFHLTPDGPQLIEINTNAGGAMLNALLLRAARGCCAEVEHLAPSASSVEGLDAAFVRMFEAEWRDARGDAPLQTIATVDEAPESQYLYPEFLLFQDLFTRAGYRALIVPPELLELRNDGLHAHGLAIDLVYNRLTDFSLSTSAAAALREAYLADAVVVTPHPRAHALYADKRNLALLSDSAALRALGAPEGVIATLAAAVPRTEVVRPDNAERLWSERRKLFFKPVSGFGSRGVYRGDKLTRRAWGDVLAGDYIAQTYLPPSERIIGNPDAAIALKADFRNYVYRGEVQLVAARLYQGQTTNFRTPGGGFAPVFSPRAAVADPLQNNTEDRMGGSTT